jgi:hypothetical protein
MSKTPSPGRAAVVHVRLFRIWSGMKQRCRNPNNQRYARYGGRGITYTPEWETFAGFYNSIPPGYQPHLCLDRTDNDGHYTPENTRWVSIAENNRNTNRPKKPPRPPKVVVLTPFQEEVGMTVSSAALIAGLSNKTIRERFRRGDRGDFLLRQADKPGYHEEKEIEPGVTLSSLAVELGIPRTTLLQRFRAGHRGSALRAPLHTMLVDTGSIRQKALAASLYYGTVLNRKRNGVPERLWYSEERISTRVLGPPSPPYKPPSRGVKGPPAPKPTKPTTALYGPPDPAQLAWLTGQGFKFDVYGRVI